MADDEARERARKRLEQRRVRMRDEVPAASDTHELINSGRLRSRCPGTGNRHSWDVHGAEAVLAFSETAMNLVRAIGFKRLTIAIAALVVVLVVVSAIRGCAADADGPEPNASNDAALEQQEPRDPIDEAALAAVVGDEYTASLVAAAETNDDVAWIAAHPAAYGVDGEAVQYKLLKLAATEPEAVPFVRGFPDAYPDSEAEGTGDPASGEVPRLYQWDPRWGFTVYSSTTFAVTGCCPTSLSMVYQGLTGKGDLSPYDLGVKAAEGGYMAEFDGTDSSFLVNEAASLGLSCESLSLDADSVRSALEGGAVLICNVGPGDFTDNGHFFVITGIDGDGSLVINDPYSAERSSRTWNVDDVLGQTKALWAYRLV